jgi:hypothetical protein
MAVDASAYGMLGHILHVACDPPLKTYFHTQQNLLAFCQRIRASDYATHSA